MLFAKEIEFSYDESTNVLDSLSLSLEKGTISALIGRSGCGKTTLFKALAGIVQPTQGTLLIDGTSHPDASKKLSYMTQRDLLLPWRTVLGNLLLLSELGKERIFAQEIKEEARVLLHEVGLTGKEGLYPHELSEGMRQRVSLARALLQKKPLLILDEPFGSLDMILREEMYALLHTIQKKYGTTILMITHDFVDAWHCEQLFLMQRGSISKTWQIPPSADPVQKQELLEEVRGALQQTPVT